MKRQGTRLIAAACFTLGLGLSGNAHAVWSFANSGSNTTFTDSGVSVTLSAVYATNATFSGSGTWAAATLTDQGSYGKGICSANDSSGTPCNSPDHAIDNNVNTEAVLLNFSSSVSLSSIGIGWTYTTNSDISLFRWTGTGTPTGNPTALIGQDANSMTGWELVGNYGDINTDTSNPYNLVNSTGKGSSWWFISAYNSGYAATAGETRLGTGNVALDNGNDYFKLYAIAGSKCTSTTPGQCGPTNKTPEPGSLALASFALLGVIAARRRSAK